MGEMMLLDWKGHDQALATKLWEFFKDEYLVDFNVTCHGQQKKVHKFVLAFLFPILKESLRSNGTFCFDHHQELITDLSSSSGESSNKIPEAQCLNLDNIAEHAEDIEYLIQFAYTGKTTVPKEHADCLMRIADAMEIKCLKESINRRRSNRNKRRLKSPEFNDRSEPTKEVLERLRFKKVKVIEERVDLISSNDDDDDDDANCDNEDEDSSLESAECSESNSSSSSSSSTNNKKTGSVNTNRNKSEDDHFKGKKPIKLVLKQALKNLKKNDDIEAENGESSSNEKGKKSLKCPECDYTALFPYMIDRHLKRHVKKRAKGPKEFSCKICKKRFETRLLLEIHRDSNCGTEPPVCKYCDFKTHRKQILQQHIMSLHHVDVAGNPLEKNVKCPDCDFVCYAKHQLRVHERSKHERMGKFKCNDCNYTAPYVKDIRRHEKQKHQNIRDYMCDECGSRFLMMAHLKRHVLARHKGVKPHKCNICSAEYSDSLSFKIHMQRHEGKVEYRFVCHICGHNLRRRYEFKAHMRKKHGIEHEEEEEITAKAEDFDPCRSSEEKTNKDN